MFKNILVKFLSLLCLMVWASVAQAGGLQVTDKVVGTGQEALKEKVVEVHYTGWLMNAKKFDSSRDRQKPFVFTLGAGEVIPGWDQGVLGMKVGGKRELIVPSDLAYGPRGAGGVIPPNATLRFEIELLKVTDLPYKNVTNEEAKALLKEGVTLIDIRTVAEWKETGVIEGSKLLPFLLSRGKPNLKFAEDMLRIVGPKERVILICRSGNRSRSASKLLSARFGYERIYNMRHGIRSWQGEKNQTVKPDLESVKKTCSLC